MKHYIVYNNNGDIVQSISSTQDTTDFLLFDHTLLEIEEPIDTRNKRVVNGQIVELDSFIEPELGYEFKRHLEYPSVKLQLDMLWHDIDQGLFGSEARTGTFYQTIQSIKQQIPKS